MPSLGTGRVSEPNLVSGKGVIISREGKHSKDGVISQSGGRTLLFHPTRRIISPSLKENKHESKSHAKN